MGTPENERAVLVAQDGGAVISEGLAVSENYTDNDATATTITRQKRWQDANPIARWSHLATRRPSGAASFCGSRAASAAPRK